MITDKTVIVGDWHKDIDYIWKLLTVLNNKDVDTIIHVGDVGFMIHAEEFADWLTSQLASKGMQLYFIEGNHEDYKWLEDLEVDSDGLGVVRENIRHIPRGFRTSYDGKEFLFVGGGVSVDQYRRTRDYDWWAEEEITNLEVDQIISAGSADVLVSHDCPAHFELDLPHSHMFPSDLIDKSDEHREKLESIYKGVGAGKVVCGHYHIYRKQSDLVVLDCNNRSVDNTQYIMLNEFMSL